MIFKYYLQNGEPTLTEEQLEDAYQYYLGNKNMRKDFKFVHLNHFNYLDNEEDIHANVDKYLREELR